MDPHSLWLEAGLNLQDTNAQVKIHKYNNQRYNFKMIKIVKLE